MKLITKFKSLDRFLQSVTLLLVVIFFTITATFISKIYFERTLENKWNEISNDKNRQVVDECVKLFEDGQKSTSDYSASVVKNKKFVTSFSNQNLKRCYEILQEDAQYKNFNIEVYNSRLELFLFEGRQQNPDILELKRALDGKRFSLVKEIGFFRYLSVYEPVIAENNLPAGVLITSKLIDVNYDINNEFFRDFGLTNKIKNTFNADVTFDFNIKPAQFPDSLSKDFTCADLKSITGESIGTILIPVLDKSSYLSEVKNSFSTLLSFQFLVLALILFVCGLKFSRSSKNIFVRIIVSLASLILLRFVLLYLGIPASLFRADDTGIFSPLYFSSTALFGLASSIGEYLITSAFALAASFMFASRMLELTFERNWFKFKYLNLFLMLFGFAAVLFIMQSYGQMLQTIVNDSSLKLIDKDFILSFSNVPSFFLKLVILLLSVSVVIVSSMLILIASRSFLGTINHNKLVRKYSILLITAFLILLGFIIDLLIGETSLKLNYEILIISLCGITALVLQRRKIFSRQMVFGNATNISLVFLSCIIFVPFVLLNNITSQENKNLEKLARDVSTQSNERISSLISFSLDDISENKQLENEIKDKNKYPKLAFNIWLQSKLYNEDFNSAVFVLDTAKKIISDFNLNPSELVADSIIKFSFNEKSKPEEIEIVEDEQETEIEKVSENILSDLQEEAKNVWKNDELKFYAGMIQIERADLKKSGVRRVAGYVIIAAQYDAKNFLTQSNLGIFKSFSRDNVISKLTSEPVISEFTNGELVGSSSRDVSKAFVKSFDAFRESVKDKTDKSALRYDEIENQLYKSFYILKTIKTGTGESPEKIYISTVAVNEVGLSSYFFFYFLLFAVFVFIIFLVIYFSTKLILIFRPGSERPKFIFGFREKLFALFLGASIIPFIILAVYTREYVKDKNNEFYRNQLISDLRILEQYVKSRSALIKLSDTSKQKNNIPESQTTFQNIFDRSFSESDKSFNLYVKNKINSTTNEQLYKSDFLDTRISGDAFYNIVLMKKDYFSENQLIGSFNFIAGYKPYYDSYNKLIGILSSQTVFRQSEINRELNESLIYIFGPYFLGMVFLVIIVNIISFRISNPIVKLQKATQELSRGNIDVQVKTTTSDEIGELVRLFNTMTKELKRSREELKKAERESAWRDIARQVAHEIKNPLTPMKLAMQYLYYSYTNSHKDFKTIIQTTNRLIVEQIETLNRIATEFSDFAKLPKRNYEPLNVDEILSDVVKLFNSHGNIHFLARSADAFGNGAVKVTADKDELRRAFINIIRNALHAVENKEKGIVEVDSGIDELKPFVRFRDNGEGMDKETLGNLFKPYFSTKSSGMGLGLVITKKILDDMNAKISVSSKEGEGTEVMIEFKSQLRGE